MSKKTGICLICLHTDKHLKNIDTKLSDFHDELCGSAVKDPRYCSQCECLLGKAYKFREKCLTAMDILNTWNNSKGVDKKPITDLCTLLPESLNVWMSDDAQIHSIADKKATPPAPGMITVELRIEPEQRSESDAAEDTTESQELHENSLLKDIKLERNETEICQTEDKSVKYSDDFHVIKQEDSKKGFNKIVMKSKGSIRNDNRSGVVNDIVKDFSNRDNDDDNITNLQDNGKSNLNENVRNLEYDKSDEQSDVVNDILNNYNNSEDDNKLTILKNRLLQYKQNQNKTRKGRLDKNNYSENVKLSEKILIVVKKENYCNKKSVTKKNKDSKSIAKKTIAKKIVDKDITKKIKFNSGKAVAEVINKDSTTNNGYVERNIKICKKLPFTKERLQEELKSKFASCGDLRAADGTLIDKEFILQCLDDKVTEYYLKQLYQAVHRKSGFKPSALRLFKCIQNKYKNEYDSVFDIEYLNTKEKMIEEFQKRPTYASYVTAEFKCEICYQGFKHEKKLEYHNKCCHDVTAGEMICTICKVREQTVYKLSKHMNLHEAVYKCKLCPLVTYYKTSMHNHYQQHKGVKYTCKQCNAEFGSNSAYKTHISIRHARSHVCTSCGRAFATRVGLRVHLTRDHKNEAPLAMSVKCEECSLFFVSEEARAKHAQVTHRNVTRGRPAGGTRSYVRRLGRDPKPPSVTCRECGASGSFGWLTLHFRTEHPTLDMDVVYADRRKHLCHICAKAFCTVASLRFHLNTHSGLRPYACDLCPKRCHSSATLNEHRLRHFPPTKECKECGKKFKTQSNLHNHMLLHIGTRRHKCSICGKAFLHSAALNEHVRGVHYNVRRVKKGTNAARGETDTMSGGEMSD